MTIWSLILRQHESNSWKKLQLIKIVFVSELEDGKIMYDAHFNSEILVKCPVMCTTADNPRASEFEHHLGSCANKFCRKCNVSFKFLFDETKTISQRNLILINHEQIAFLCIRIIKGCMVYQVIWTTRTKSVYRS